MNNKKPRSSLKKSVTEEADPVRQTRRRISFSGKKFIREFDTTEKARDYDYSCEISDHTNGDDSSGQSHVTAAATTLQTTSTVQHISYANEMDKENTPLHRHSVTGVEPFPSEYDQHQKSYTLQLQTSVNVTLMPHEMNRSRQRMELSAGLEFSSFDSLSLSESEREKLRENSTFRHPVFDKTIDLMPHRMLGNVIEQENMEKENVPQTSIMPGDISSVALDEKNFKQRTVLFENNDITCDFEDIDPQHVVAPAFAKGTPKPKDLSITMDEPTDYINYMEDDSTSSPLIPLDVISENGIKRKLNFLQLNEALNSGRIQLFPNGPRTPITDRTKSHQRFWHGLGDDNSSDQELPFKAAIKPRGTINFNESMMMSPATQRPPPALKPAETISNNRFSQADELMLDNTNFLVHAKVGDETQSRNSSKCTSRRETTYNNTAMELDNLEKDEAAVVAALERVTRQKPILHRMDVQNIQCNEQKMKEESVAPLDNKSRRSIRKVEAIEEDAKVEVTQPAAPAGEPEYVISRKSLHFVKDISGIDEDLQLTDLDNFGRQEANRRRQTLHKVEPMEEDTNELQAHLAAAKLQHEVSIAATVASHHNKHRQTIHQAEPIEEDIVNINPQSDTNVQSSPAVPHQQNVRRQTLHMAVPIEEDMDGTRQETHFQVPERNSRRRQTVNMAIAIEEDLVKQQPESARKPIGPLAAAKMNLKRRESVHVAVDMEEDFAGSNEEVNSASTAPAAAQHSSRSRQTVYMCEAIQEDAIRPQMESSLKSTAPVATQQISRRRQTLHMSEAIEEELPEASTVAVASHSNRHRQTLHMTEPIEEEKISLEPSAPNPAQQNSRRRETLHMTEDIEEEVVRPQQEINAKPTVQATTLRTVRHRQTLHMAEPIEEDFIESQHQKRLKPSALGTTQQSGRRRETMHMTEDIEEEEVRLKDKTPQASFRSNRHRETLHMAEPIEEDLQRPQQELSSQQPAPAAIQHDYRHRQTMHMTEDIEEEPRSQEFATKSTGAAPPQQSSRRRETLHMTEDIEEELPRPTEECNTKPNPTTKVRTGRHRQTLHMAEPIEEELVRPLKDISLQPKAFGATQPSSKRRETLHMTEDIEEEARTQELITKPTMHVAIKQSYRRRETMHMTEDIEEEMIRPEDECNTKSTNSSASQRNSRRRETLHTVEDIEGDSFCSPKEWPETADAFKENPQSTHSELPSVAVSAVKSSIFGKYFDISDPFEENEISTQEVLEQNTAPEQAPNQKPWQTLLLAEPIEEETCTVAATYKPQSVGSLTEQHNRKSRNTINMPEDIDEDCFATKHDSPVRKPRQTMHVEEAINDETAPEKALNQKSRQTLLLAEPIEEETCSVEATYKPQSVGSLTDQHNRKSRNTINMPEDIDEDCFVTKHDSPVRKSCQTMHVEEAINEEMPTSAPKVHKVLATEQSPEKNKSIFNPSIARIIMETPKVNKSQYGLNRSMFPITPGRSMIEYEDLEEMCNVDSEICPPHEDMDMDTSSCGTPVQVSKPMTSCNIKRLPIHLTPNLPEAKKRNMEDHQDRDNHQQTPVSKNRSRIPVLSKTLNQSSTNTEQEQLDGTVQMVRAQMMRQTRSDFSTEVTRPMEEKLKANPAAYEDNPITISDVSSHFAAQQEMAKQSLRQPIDVNRRSSNENTKRQYAADHKEFINISGDTMFFDAVEMLPDNIDENEVEKTRLSLVSTLLDEENDETADESVVEFDAGPNMIDNINDEPEDIVKSTTICLQQLNPPVTAGAENACKRCNHCRFSMNATAFGAEDSFELPDWNGLQQGLKHLERLRQKPSLEEVDRFWQLKKMESYSEADEILEDTAVELNIPVSLSLSEMLHMCNKKLQEFSSTPSVKQRVEPFVNRLDAKLRAQKQCRWIFDYQLQCDRQYIFTHRKITTLRIVVNYEPQDVSENEIRVRSIIGTTPSFIPRSQYKLPDRIQHLLQGYPCDFKAEFLNRNGSTFEHLLDFQLRLKLPLNLHNLLDSNDVDGFLQFLQRIDNKCRETTKLCSDMQLLLIANKAQLLRQSNRTIVRKTIRKYRQFPDEAFMRVEKMHFIIEIGNVEEISFNDILQPPLYQFNEKIQFLTKGISFLKAFLPNPEEYLNPNVKSNI